MPYRINPRNPREVQVKKKGVWRREKLHPSIAKARRHLGALKKNVPHGGG